MSASAETTASVPAWAGRPSAGGLRWCGGLLAVAVVLRLVMASGMTTPLNYLPHDDLLFITHAHSILSGEWLGAYDRHTLAKGPGFPIYLALVRLLGIPFTLSLQLAWCGVGVATYAFFRRLSGRPWLALAIAVLLLFHPYSFSGGPDAQVNRDRFYMALVVGVILAAGWAGLIARRAQVSTTVACLLLGWALITREEGVWLFPSALLLGLLIARREGTLGRRVLTLAVCAVLTMVPVWVVCGLNYGVYRYFGVTDVKERHFTRAYGMLSSIDPVPHYRVPATKGALRRAAEASPTFAKYEKWLAGQLGEAWGQASLNTLRPEDAGEMAGGAFIWALRDAVGNEGDYRSPSAARKAFARIGAELEAAAREGKLTFRARAAGGLLPALPPGGVAEFARSTVRCVEEVILLRQWTALPRGSDPTFGQFDIAREVTLATPSAPPDQVTFRVSGWAIERGGRALAVRVRPEGSSTSVPITARWADSPDLVALAPGNPQAARARFSVDGHYPVGQGEPVLEFLAGEQVVGQLTLRGAVELDNAAVRAHIDFRTFRGPAGVMPEGGKAGYPGRIVRSREVVAGVYRAVYPYVLLLGTVVGLGLYLVPAWRGRTLPVAGAWLVLGAIGVALVVRCVLLGYIDASSFPAVNTLYLAPAYPLPILLVGVLLSRRAGPKTGGPTGGSIANSGTGDGAERKSVAPV